jgi:DNA-binding transcriptional regulator YiaG
MKPSEKCKVAGLKSLADFIDDEHGGNNSAFAKRLGVERNQVQQWLKAQKPVYVYEKKLVTVVRDFD